MANTRTVGSSGKDHTDVASALSWMQTNHDFATDGIGTISIEEDAEFTESLTINSISGTPSITAYLHIKAAAANAHEGVAGTGHARIRNTTGNRVFQVETDFTYISDLEIQTDTTGSSDEGIRITSGTDDVLISRCIIWTDRTGADQDGIYTSNWSATIAVDNCVIYGYNRSGIHMQMNSGGTDSQTWDLAHLTIYDCGQDQGGDCGGICWNKDTGDTLNITAYNVAVLNCNGGSADDWHQTGSGSLTSFTGSHNADTDGTLSSLSLGSSNQGSLTVSTTTQSSGSYFVVTNVTAGSEDFNLLDDAAGNLAYGNGTDRQGSEPDTRQDFSTDIAGNTRSTTSPSPDIGAFEYETGGGPTYTLTSNSGSYTLSGTSADLDASRLLTSNSGSYTLTGTSVDLNLTRLLTANSGSYTLSGTSIDLDKSSLLTANSGSYTLTGTNADLDKSSLLAANSGSYTLTGTDADLTYQVAGSYTLTANAGAYTLTGTDVDLDKSSLLTANSGSYTLTGTNAELDRQFGLTANSGSYALTGTDASMIASFLLNASSGGYNVNGSNVALTYSSGLVWTIQSGSSALWTAQTADTSTWTIQ